MWLLAVYVFHDPNRRWWCFPALNREWDEWEKTMKLILIFYFFSFFEYLATFGIFAIDIFRRSQSANGPMHIDIQKNRKSIYIHHIIEINRRSRAVMTFWLWATCAESEERNECARVKIGEYIVAPKEEVTHVCARFWPAITPPYFLL